MNNARQSSVDITNNFENALVSIIQHCPNLEIFIVEQPLKGAFGPVADALKTYSPRGLRTVQWNVTGDALSKVIWALDSLPYLISVHIDIETPVPPDQECAKLGSATDLPLCLANLQQLSLRGFMTEFLEQSVGWDMPSLRSFAVDSGISQYDTPDIIAFLTSHGQNLVVLDLNLNVDPPVDVPTVLDICPALTTFTFNADWRLNVLGGVCNITKRPHLHISTIGLHGLSYAFGIPVGSSLGAVAGEDSSYWSPLLTQIRGRYNDLNMAGINKSNFPKLRRIRALSQSMLNGLNRSNGPSSEIGSARWNRWSTTCAGSGIRLEDCTGQPLGTLPQDDEYEDESEEDESGEEESDDDEDQDGDDDDDSGEWESDEEEPEWGRRVSPLPEGNGRTMELTRLLEECRVMNEGRDEEMIARIHPADLDESS